MTTIAAVAVLLSLIATGTGCGNGGGGGGTPPPAADPCSEITIVSRSGWNAVAPKSRTSMPTPARHVYIHHTDTPSCFSSSSCSSRVRNIQHHHMNKPIDPYFDIGYSFLIGGDGKVYEGRGWGREGAHTCCRYYNRIGHGIAFIGTYTSTTPSSTMINTAKKLIQCGVNKNKISSSYSVAGHQDACSTTCPGSALYREISGWSKFHSIALPRNNCPNRGRG